LTIKLINKVVSSVKYVSIYSFIAFNGMELRSKMASK
jgi:hypothetical protein